MLRSTRTVVVPGWANDCSSISSLVEALAPATPESALHVINIHEGVSEHSPSGTTNLSPYAYRLAENLEAESVVIGWSMGGMIAIEAAAVVPDRVSALVLLATSPRFCQGEDYRYGFACDQLDSLADDLRTDTRDALSTFIRWSARPFDISDAAMGDRIDAAEGLGLDALLAGLEYLRSQDLRRRLSSITCPTLVMHGRNDAVVPWRGGKQLADALPRSTWVEMQHAGHDFPLRSPGAIAEHICQFCDALMPETQTVTPEGS